MFFNIFTRDVGFNIAWPLLFALILDLMEFLFAQFQIFLFRCYFSKKDLILFDEFKRDEYINNLSFCIKGIYNFEKNSLSNFTIFRYGEV